jgi:hypothetical protein
VSANDGEVTPIFLSKILIAFQPWHSCTASLPLFQCPQIVEGVFDLLSLSMMIRVGLNIFEPPLDCFFRRDNAFGQLLRIEFKHCGPVDFEPRFVFTCKHDGMRKYFRSTYAFPSLESGQY